MMRFVVGKDLDAHCFPSICREEQINYMIFLLALST